jgi:hypothetical protein
MACSDTLSPFLAPPRASGSNGDWLVDSIPPCPAKDVEAGRHIPSYLYMAPKRECVSLRAEIFNGMRGSCERRTERWMRAKIFIDTDHGSWDSAGVNMAVVDSMFDLGEQNGFGKRTSRRV